MGRCWDHMKGIEEDDREGVKGNRVKLKGSKGGGSGQLWSLTYFSKTSG